MSSAHPSTKKWYIKRTTRGIKLEKSWRSCTATTNAPRYQKSRLGYHFSQQGWGKYGNTAINYLSPGHVQQQSLSPLFDCISTPHDRLVDNQHEVIFTATKRDHVFVLISAHESLQQNNSSDTIFYMFFFAILRVFESNKMDRSCRVSHPLPWNYEFDYQSKRLCVLYISKTDLWAEDKMRCETSRHFVSTIWVTWKLERKPDSRGLIWLQDYVNLIILSFFPVSRVFCLWWAEVPRDVMWQWNGCHSLNWHKVKNGFGNIFLTRLSPSRILILSSSTASQTGWEFPDEDAFLLLEDVVSLC